MGGYAWVTLATNDAYSLGALVLAHSLRRVDTVHELAVLVTPGVTETMREKLSAVFSVVMEVNVLDSKDEANLALLARPELGITFTKLHCWRLTQYEKCVFLDADTLVVRNCDELFEREELSAAPDVGWPDCFNSGVFVYKPCQQTFASITSFAAAKGSFDGGDQGLLNMYFSDWARKDISKHLPFIYNMCSTATYSYLPAFKQFGEDVRIIHFIGITKPWLQYFDTLTGIVQPPMGSAHLQPLLQLWWNIFCEKVHPHLSPVMAGLAGALAQMTLGEPRSAAQVALEEHMRKQSWEQGQIDYMGRDSFDNIWKKICETLALAPSRLPSPPKETEKPAKTPADETAEPTESIESVEPIEVTQPIEAADEVDKGTAQATTSHTEEQSLVNNVPITNNDNIISKLSEKGKQVVDITSAETNENKQPVSEGVTKDITQESSTKSETESLDTIVDPSPAQPSMQASPEKIIEELNTSSLLKEASQETAEIVVEELCAGSLLVEAAQETIEKVVEELSAGSLLKEALQETTPPRVPADSVQSCSIGEHKDESPSSKDSASASAIFAAPTEQLASNVTDIIDLQIAVDVEQPKSSDIKDEKHAKELLTASEVLTISPVPIQVAESVLQVEPKESVTDSQAVTEEVLSSTITPVHESDVPCSESLTDAGNKIQVNGSASGVVSAESEGKSSRSTAEAVESIDAATILSESSTPSTETSQALPPTEEPLLAETSALPSSITKSTETSQARVDKTSQQTTESDQQTKETASYAKETKETKESTKPPSECAVAEASPSSESPVRPSRAKELNVPSTSAPETPAQESKDQEKITKKAARKSIDKSASEGEPGETTEGDSTGKKVAKKVVKKVTKKPKSKPEEALDDGAQDSSSANKPKKTVKVTKKGTKSLQTPDAPDAAVSETPSSSTSDTPVPPKRKSKAPPTKPAVKKPDVE